MVSGRGGGGGRGKGKGRGAHTQAKLQQRRLGRLPRHLDDAVHLLRDAADAASVLGLLHGEDLGRRLVLEEIVGLVGVVGDALKVLPYERSGELSLDGIERLWEAP